jgi:hypothetical protein
MKGENQSASQTFCDEEERSRERRRLVMYVTRNSEYHLRDNRCVAVRDRQAGRWRMTHSALNQELTGIIRYARGEAYPMLANPEVGDALFFSDGEAEVVTTILTAIERPPKALVDSYPF